MTTQRRQRDVRRAPRGASASKSVGDCTAGKTAAAGQTTPDQHRAVFVESGLAYGRSFGSKSSYARLNPRALFISNACVVTRNGCVVWNGDLDLSAEHDVRALAEAGRRINRVLFVLREQNAGDVPRGRWLAENAVVKIWRGTVETTGTVRDMYGSLKEVIAKRGSSEVAAPKRRRKLNR